MILLLLFIAFVPLPAISSDARACSLIALNQDVLEQVPYYLQAQDLDAFSRTCTVFYKIARRPFYLRSLLGQKELLVVEKLLSDEDLKRVYQKIGAYNTMVSLQKIAKKLYRDSINIVIGFVNSYNLSGEQKLCIMENSYWYSMILKKDDYDCLLTIKDCTPLQIKFFAKVIPKFVNFCVPIQSLEREKYFICSKGIIKLFATLSLHEVEIRIKAVQKHIDDFICDRKGLEKLEICLQLLQYDTEKIYKISSIIREKPILWNVIQDQNKIVEIIKGCGAMALDNIEDYIKKSCLNNIILYQYKP